MSQDLISLFSASFVTFFVLVDALGVAPVFASMTAPGGPAYSRKMAIKSVFVATIIVFAFAFGGSWLLEKMHISCLLYTSPSPRDPKISRMPSSA